MNNQERSDMKKIIFLFILLIFVPNVDAINLTDITTDTQIKYKWYRDEITESFYYPKKDELIDYLEDINQIEYGEYSEWSSDYCNYDSNYYLIENTTITTYEKLDKIKYVLIANASATCPSGRCTDSVNIYYNHENINYKVLSDSYSGLLIELPQKYEPEKLMFHIVTEHQQVIYLSKVKNIPPITISSPASSKNIIFVNDNWQATDSSYITVETTEKVPDIPLIKNIKTKEVCRVREIKTFRYKLTKEYYDDNYYESLDDYFPDITNYQVYYTKSIPETKEIIKEVLVPKIEKEYIYLESENTDDNCISEEQPIIYKTEYKEKIINKAPLKIYITLIILVLSIIFLLVKLLTKNVD